MNTSATYLSRIAQPFTYLLKTVERRIAIWRLKQQLASYEYLQATSQRRSHEGYVLVTRKLRYDLEALTERRDTPAPKAARNGLPAFGVLLRAHDQGIQLTSGAAAESKVNHDFERKLYPLQRRNHPQARARHVDD